MSSKPTVNKLLSMQKMMVQRRQQLNELKGSLTMRTMYRNVDMSNERIEEPTYDIKKVDKKIVDLNNVLFRIDSSIKESNARTEIDIEIDYDKLMSEIE